MKRIILLAMVLVMMIVSIGGCFIGRGGEGRGDRGGGHERDGGQQRDGGHEEHQEHQERGERR